MTVRHFFCYCDWIGQPPEEYSVKQDIDIYNMLMPRLNEEEPGNFTDHFGDVILDKSKVNVYLDSNEPDFYAPYPMDMLLEKAPHFDLILTRRPELLKFPNARLFLFGTHWVADYQNAFENKKNAISYAMTGKDSDARFNDLIAHGVQPAIGYHVRHQIGGNFENVQKVSNLQIDGYNSERYPTSYAGLQHTLSSSDDGKLELMKYKFHIAVENSALPNYMTEKLHDCFMTKTVPIYFGCPNVSDFYNMDGILQFNTSEELVDILKSLDDNSYDKMKDAVEDNHRRFLDNKLDTFQQRLWSEIEKVDLL
jgi:hypothetical protein